MFRFFNKHLKSLILLAVLAVSSLACQLNAGGPTPPASITVSQEAVDELTTIWQSVQTNSNDNIIAVTLTEEQVTSFLASQLNSQADPILYNPQVFLRNGQIEIYGQIIEDSITANVRLAMKVKINAEGNPEFELVSADFGILPVPVILLESISSILENLLVFSNDIDMMLSNIIPSAAFGLKLETVFIADGMITITGIKH